MGTTQPIREKDDLKKFLDYYRHCRPNTRNYALITFGLHTALRIGDILNLKWENVYDFGQNRLYDHLFLKEKKTGKQNIVALNRHLKDTLNVYRCSRNPQPTDYIFTKTTDYTHPLSRSQAFRIMKKAAVETLHTTHVSCHSLRKTFGYHAWKQGVPPALLMDIFNHSSYSVTKKYLGIDQDERDSIFMEIDLL
ncbi:tyrosine-type recombinase/integrase [Lachnospiraceae bacterium JLR.KK009]|nr:tyrosine-type recombinase/integrase [Lachnospiraceae bacterium]MCI8882609.1 tyrosine-type recombinase/integrase [Lachnospiraceae bacterium]